MCLSVCRATPAPAAAGATSKRRRRLRLLHANRLFISFLAGPAITHSVSATATDRTSRAGPKEISCYSRFESNTTLRMTTE